MDQPTSPQANFSALDDERDTDSRSSRDPQLDRAAARWESPGKRKFIPAVVIGVAVVGLAVGMDYKFRHKAEQPSTTLAQGPAVETMVNQAPPGAGTSADTTTAQPADQRANVTPPDNTPAAAPPPPPTPAPRAEHAAPRAITPAPRPAVPDPEPMPRSVPSEPAAVTPTPAPEAPVPAQQAIQPPSPMPAPEAPSSEKPNGI